MSNSDEGSIQFTVHDKSLTTNFMKKGYVGHQSEIGKTIGNAQCPFCNVLASFRQYGIGVKKSKMGRMLPIQCANCRSVLSVSTDKKRIYPAPGVNGLEELPDEIDKYYQESLRCLEANAPNGATTLYRKVINAVCIHYDITNVDENTSIYEMVNKLSEKGHIVETQRKALLATKDVGNDGAHMNDNDPTLERARQLKNLVDAVLQATIKVEQGIAAAREDHPNPHQE